MFPNFGTPKNNKFSNSVTKCINFEIALFQTQAPIIGVQYCLMTVLVPIYFEKYDFEINMI